MAFPFSPSDIERGPVERDDVVACRTFVNDGGPELAPGTEHGYAHHAALTGAAPNARIRPSSNTPSQRATTTVAMQLPMTFTAVRPMSMI